MKTENLENKNCPDCGEKTLEIVPENLPMDVKHIACENCDATFNIF